MFNRYTSEKRTGPKLSEAEQELNAKLEARREERRKRTNAEYAARASKRVEEWMATEVDEPKAEEEADQNPFQFEFRKRNKDKEIGSGPGHHALSGTKYVTQAERVAIAEEMGKMATRGEYQEIRYGESPFRKRVKQMEKHPPIRFKDVTEAERINASTNSITGGTGPGADPLKEPQMGFDDIPVGMRPDTVVVRAKAKAPGPLTFKRFGHSRPRMLNPPDKYCPEEYITAAEPTGYGFTKFNNFRPRRRDREIDQTQEYLPGVRGGLILGTTTSKRRDRMDPINIDRPEPKFYTAAKTMVVMPGSDAADEVMQSNQDGQPETRVDLANRMLRNKGANKARHFETLDPPANGPNVYAWNEVFKFKDHKM